VGAVRSRDRIRRDLEEHGVGSDFSEPVAQLLEPATRNFSASEYDAVLMGVAAAYAVYEHDSESVETARRDVDEIQGLMRGFASELRKVEESLRIVSAFVLRMHAKAVKEPSGLVH
jgi:hypothetical protein